MPTGYEKSPDYGGEPPETRAVVAGVVAFVSLLILLNWFFKGPPKDCWTLGEDEITYTEVNGKQRATLDLRRIPKGECVTINTSKPTGRPSQALPEN